MPQGRGSASRASRQLHLRSQTPFLTQPENVSGNYRSAIRPKRSCEALDGDPASVYGALWYCFRHANKGRTIWGGDNLVSMAIVVCGSMSVWVAACARQTKPALLAAVSELVGDAVDNVISFRGWFGQ